LNAAISAAPNSFVTLTRRADDLILRDVVADDLPIFFTQQLDPEANHMAAFTVKEPAEREAFDARWRRMLCDPSIRAKTIVQRGEVVGSVMSYEEDGKPEVTYWIGREFWGRGIAARALEKFLREVNQARPIYARVAADHLRSRRVLEKCGFEVSETARGFANARGMEIEELLLKLQDLDGRTQSAPA
jgi:RimJ/RimL family protein N-acetyltransferase